MFHGIEVVRRGESMVLGSARIPVVSIIFCPPQSEGLHCVGCPIGDVLGPRDHSLKSGALEQATECSAAMRVRRATKPPKLFADRIEPAKERLVWSRKYQAAILHTGDPEDTAGFECAFDFLEAIKRAVKSLQHGMAKTGIKMVAREIQ